MITQFVDESPTKKSFTLEIPADIVRQATDRAARALGKQVRLPGFRPGKAPLDLLKKRFAEAIREEVLDHLVRDAVGDALREKKLFPVGNPKIEDLKFEPDAPVSFRVDLEVRPVVEPKEYRGLKVPSESVEPSAEEIDRVFQRIREGHASYEAIEGRPAADGDYALVDIKGSFPNADGEDFTADKTLIEIGGKETMAELSAHLRNAEPGATATFQKDFPADAEDSRFAGKTVLYTVNLVALKKQVLPELDDELAREVLTPRDGEAPENASLDLLKEKVTASVKSEKERDARTKKRRAALDGLLALNPVDAPESMVESEVDSAVKEYSRFLARQGVDLKTAQIDWNALRNEARPAAVRRVKEYLLLDAVGEAEKIEATDTELDAEIRSRAASAGMGFAELKAMLVKGEKLEGLREELRIEKVTDFLLAEAVTAG
ncbi:MAG TPA: trigger factor [Thermoanaerobaculia bacterium]|nr:trigger factor [Thermoanaerobaculia bacterium]